MKTSSKALIILGALLAVNYLGWYAHGHKQIDTRTCEYVYKNTWLKTLSLRAIDKQVESIPTITRIVKIGAAHGMKSAINTCHVSGKL